jgi:hypothetical protein
MRAWWSGDLTTLLAAPPEAIVQRLVVRLVETHHLNHAAQLTAWREQVPLLQAVARGLPGEWRVLLEYPLLRLGKRIDTVLLTDRAILVLEFKTADQTRLAREQVEDYALDLLDFHAVIHCDQSRYCFNTDIRAMPIYDTRSDARCVRGRHLFQESTSLAHHETSLSVT